MTKAQRKTLETAIARLEKLHGDLNMIQEKVPVMEAIQYLRKAEAAYKPAEDGARS